MFYKQFVYLGKNSLWIYLIHYFVIQAIYTIIKTSDNNFYLEYFIFVLIGVPFSVIFSLIFKKVYLFFVNLIMPKKAI